MILVVIGISLLGFVALRFLQAFNKEGRDRSDIKGWFQRAGKAISGLIYLSISYYAIKLALQGKSEGADSKKLIVGRVLEMDAGQYLIGLVGLIIIGQGIYQIFRGATAAFMKKVELHHSNFKKTFLRIGVIGHISRGLVLCIIGYFLVRSAINSNPKEAEGTEKVFAFLQEKGGVWLLFIIAAGLFGYGVFMFVRARHERIRLK